MTEKKWLSTYSYLCKKSFDRGLSFNLSYLCIKSFDGLLLFTYSCLCIKCVDSTSVKPRGLEHIEVHYRI
jgi:hypothetical protein